MSKGSRQRPYDKGKFDSEHERIFGKKKNIKTEPTPDDEKQDS